MILRDSTFANAFSVPNPLPKYLAWMLRLNANSHRLYWSSFRKRELIWCAVFGCGNFDPPEGAALQRSGEDAVVICNKTGETWYVTCRDGFWFGTVGNCTKFGMDISLFVGQHFVIVIIFCVLRCFLLFFLFLLIVLLDLYFSSFIFFLFSVVFAVFFRLYVASATDFTPIVSK